MGAWEIVAEHFDDKPRKRSVSVQGRSIVITFDAELQLSRMVWRASLALALGFPHLLDRVER